jgi:3-oxoacyl-[acyl-carrier-protein] synthase-3
VYILGAGTAVPETVISSAFLAELAQGAEGSQMPAVLISEITGMRSRYSVLSPSYLRETGNATPWSAPSGSMLTPTDLSVKAAEQAIARAGITADKIGLVLADCATPVETIPSEAQRISKRLGIKVQSFDLLSSTAFFSLAFTTLLGWKAERVPEYVLLVSSATPTQRVNYRSGEERLYLGDGAGALVVSRVHQGPLAVKKAHYRAGHELAGAQTFDIFSAERRAPEYRALVREVEEGLLVEARACAAVKGDALRWIGTPADITGLKALGARSGLRVDQLWTNVDTCGDTIGASPAMVLADKWDALSSGTTVVITQSGIGSGYLVLEA